jgi:hypothetical protein
MVMIPQKEEEPTNLHRIKHFQRFADRLDAAGMRLLVRGTLQTRQAIGPPRHREVEAVGLQTASSNPRF